MLLKMKINKHKKCQLKEFNIKKPKNGNKKPKIDNHFFLLRPINPKTIARIQTISIITNCVRRGENKSRRNIKYPNKDKIILRTE